LLDPLKGSVQRHVADLKPAERADFLYQVSSDTNQVKITLSNFGAGATQNVLFGDDLFLAVHSAKTSAHGEGDYLFVGFVTGGTLVFNDPEPGLLRVTVNGDSTNAGLVSADVEITSTKAKSPGSTAKGTIREGQLDTIPVTVAAGTGEAVFTLSWKGDWSRYPTNDLDLLLIDPNGNLHAEGATLDSPETFHFATPVAGQWTALVSGFELPGGKDQYELRATADGVLIK
jgi:hypothetical protein